jgi:hypothetical protein
MFKFYQIFARLQQIVERDRGIINHRFNICVPERQVSKERRPKSRTAS